MSRQVTELGRRFLNGSCTCAGVRATAAVFKRR